MKTQDNVQPILNYIELINHFWKLNREHPFTPTEIAVYFGLLSKWNDLHRKPCFNMSTESLAVIAGVSVSTVQRAKKVLQDVKLLSFYAGEGRRKNTVYTILEPAKGSQKDGQVGGQIGGQICSQKGGHSDRFKNSKGGHKGSHHEHLSTKKEQIKVVTVNDYISKDIEEKHSFIDRDEEEKSSPSKTPIPIGSSSVFSSMADVKFICLNQSMQWQESMMKRFGIRHYFEIKAWIEKFFDEMEAQGQDKRNLIDTTSHCFRWIKIQIENKTKAAQKVTEFERMPQERRGVDAAMEWGNVKRNTCQTN